MKHYIKSNRLLLLLLTAALAVSAVMVGGRMSVERKNKSYDIVVDYNELELLAEQSDHNIEWWLSEFRDMGITRVGLTEESLLTLMENSPMDVTASMVDRVLQNAAWRDQYPDAFVSAIQDFGFDRYDVIATVRGSEATDFVCSAVTARFHPDEYLIQKDGDTAYILLDGQVNDTLYTTKLPYADTHKKGFTQRNDIASSKLIFLSLGLMPEKVQMIQSLGMEIIPRTLCYSGHNDTMYAEAVLDGYAAYDISPAYLLAGGDAILGFDDGSDLLWEYAETIHAPLGLIETNSQRGNMMQSGVQEFTEKTDLNAVRVFSVWDYIQYRYGYYGYEGAEEVENTLFRAIVERNIRVIYFKPIKETDNSFAYITDVDIYRDMFSNLDTRLAAHGITRGNASVMGNRQIPRFATVVMGLGAMLGGVLLLPAILPIKKKWTLLLAAIGAVGVVGASFVLGQSFPLLVSFASAVVMACLAAVFFLHLAKRMAQELHEDTPLLKILPRTILVLVSSLLIALAGGVMTAAPLSSTAYMLELGFFRGVKLAQLIPLAFFCLLFLACYGFFEKEREDNFLRLKDIAIAMKWQIPVWAILLAGVVGIAGLYYIARTGHDTTVSVSSLELMFRNDLEELLLARPRTKEFVVAFPCIMLATYAAIRRLPFWTALFGLAGTIGFTSVCNTFMHIRTPLYLGFARTGYSCLFGILVGVVLICVFEVLYRLYRRIEKNYNKADET